MALLHIVLFAALFVTNFAELTEFQNCEDVKEDICQVKEVRVTPCKGGKICAFKKRSNVSIAFDFAPNFITDQLETGVYWANGANDIKYADFGSSNGCDYTTCPTDVSKTQTLTYGMYINKKMGKGIFPLKWKVWNKHNDTHICCLKITIKIH